MTCSFNFIACQFLVTKAGLIPISGTGSVLKGAIAQMLNPKTTSS
ncbi:MAG TPA: hypothetical protein ACFE0H_06430 [Elainellaceae cyanobacterium]